MAEIGVTEGAVEQQDSEIIGNLLRLETGQTRDILTPRTVVMLASEEQTIKGFYEKVGELPFSRIPLYEGQMKEHISGYVLRAELLESLVQGKGDHNLKTIKREITVVHENFPISDLFNQFLEKREHIALVVDEIGGMAGIVTMEDLVEEIVGEIYDEYEKAEELIRPVGPDEWFVLCRAPIEQVAVGSDDRGHRIEAAKPNLRVERHPPQDDLFRDELDGIEHRSKEEPGQHNDPEDDLRVTEEHV